MAIVYPTNLGGKKKKTGGKKGGFLKRPRVTGAAMRGTTKKQPRRKK